MHFHKSILIVATISSFLIGSKVVLCGTIPVATTIPAPALQQELLDAKNASDSSRIEGAKSMGIMDFMPCAIALNSDCFISKANQYIELWKKDLLVQVESEERAMDRADPSNNPSNLSKVISRIISELSDLFKDGFTGLFRTAKEDEIDVNDDDDDDAKVQTNNKQKKNTGVSTRSSSLEEGRKKKEGKIKKLIKFIKLIIVAAVIAVKICILLKVFSAALQFKFFLIALAALALNIARFWLDLKKSHNPQKVIYYEHAQHQHHYENGDDDWAHGESGGGGYWGRSYDEGSSTEDRKSAQDLAYSAYKPVGTSYSRVDNKPNYSWSS